MKTVFAIAEDELRFLTRTYKHSPSDSDTQTFPLSGQTETFLGKPSPLPIMGLRIGG